MYKSEVKEMLYNRTEQSILYLEVNDDDTAIVIIDRGGWPCVYIKMPDKIYQDYKTRLNWDGYYEDIDVNVHGGVTFGSEEGLYIRTKEYGEEKLVKKVEIPDGYYLGWDYAHCGDYCYHGIPRDSVFEFDPEIEKKWTIAELMDEAHDALQQLRENGFRLYSLED